MFYLNNSCEKFCVDIGKNGKIRIVYVEVLIYKLVKGIFNFIIYLLNMNGFF